MRWTDYPELSDRERLRRYTEACLTARQIAALIGCSKTSVETAMRHHGLKRSLVLMKQSG